MACVWVLASINCSVMVRWNFAYASCRVKKMYLVRSAGSDNKCSVVLVENQTNEQVLVPIDQIHSAVGHIKTRRCSQL